MRSHQPPLPVSWTLGTIDDLCQLIGGGTPPRDNPDFFGGTIVWLTPTEIPKNKIVTINDSKEKITESGLHKSSARIIPKGSILLTSRASIGYVAIAGCDVTTNQGFASFVCQNAVYNEFLAYWLFSKKNNLEEQATGTTFKEISKTKLRELVIPLPPLPEQRRIVTKIEELFTQLDAGVASLRKTQAQLKRYRQAVLKAAFEGRLTQEWREEHITNDHLSSENWVTLGAISEVVSGYAFKSTDFTDSRLVPVIKITNVGYGEFIWQDQQYLPENFLEENQKFSVKPTTLLMALTRPITNNTLKVCIYPEDAPIALLNQRVAMIKQHSNVDINWIYYFFQTDFFKKAVENGMSQTLQPNLSPLILKELKIPIISIEEQKAIISEIERHFSQIDHLENTITTSLLQAESLRQSILKRAFEGKLVPQDLNDEPASVLLERIKAEKAKTIVSNKKKNTLKSTKSRSKP